MCPKIQTLNFVSGIFGFFDREYASLAVLHLDKLLLLLSLGNFIDFFHVFHHGYPEKDRESLLAVKISICQTFSILARKFKLLDNFVLENYNHQQFFNFGLKIQIIIWYSKNSICHFFSILARKFKLLILY